MSGVVLVQFSIQARGQNDTYVVQCLEYEAGEVYV